MAPPQPPRVRQANAHQTASNCAKVREHSSTRVSPPRKSVTCTRTRLVPWPPAYDPAEDLRNPQEAERGVCRPRKERWIGFKGDTAINCSLML
jgi:hypothetical protein